MRLDELNPFVILSAHFLHIFGYFIFAAAATAKCALDFGFSSPYISCRLIKSIRDFHGPLEVSRKLFSLDYLGGSGLSRGVEGDKGYTPRERQ